MSKLKRSVIKEEFVKLTGCYIEALILNQFLYWSERMKDVDEFAMEESRRLNRSSKFKDSDVEPNLQHGWIYKKADELIEELMIACTKPTMLKYLMSLCGKGYLSKRRNPKYAWDHTFQYRVNVVRVQRDLESLGYHLEGYRKFKPTDTDEDFYFIKEERRREIFAEIDHEMIQREVDGGR